jgi:hypothetical protein
MTLTDPFAQAPTDEAQSAPVLPPEVPVEAPEGIVEYPKIPRGPKPLKKESVSSEDGKITVTFKGGSAFDAPWIVLHAKDTADALDQVSGTNATALADLMTRVQQAAGHFVGLAPAKAPVAAGTGSVVSSAPPAGAVSAPGGESRTCAHGEMSFKSGVGASNGKPWKAFMCPTPKGTPGQCPPEWIR